MAKRFDFNKKPEKPVDHPESERAHEERTDEEQENAPQTESEAQEGAASLAEHAGVPFDVAVEEAPGDEPDTQGEPEDPELKVKKLQAALVRAEEQNMRLSADFQNFRKRKEKEMRDLIVFANKDLITQLLPVLDNFDRSLEAIEKTDSIEAIKSGIEGVARSMQQTLHRIGVEPIESIGEEFDSELHEAITTIPAPDPSMEGKVVDEVEKGYRFRDKIIRYAKVVVGE